MNKKSVSAFLYAKMYDPDLTEHDVFRVLRILQKLIDREAKEKAG